MVFKEENGKVRRRRIEFLIKQKYWSTEQEYRREKPPIYKENPYIETT